MRISDWSSDVCSSDLIVGLTIKNEYGDWVLYDAQQRPMTSRTFKSPKLALDAFLLIDMPSSKDNPLSASRSGARHKKSPVRTCRPAFFCRYNWHRFLFSRHTFKELLCLLLRRTAEGRVGTESVGMCHIRGEPP